MTATTQDASGTSWRRAGLNSNAWMTDTAPSRGSRPIRHGNENMVFHGYRDGLLLFLLLSVAAAFVAPVAANEAREIGWDDLAPAVEPYDDPFAEMTYQQIDAMRDVVAFAKATSEDPDMAAADAAGRRLLEAEGYDVDYLLRQYEVVLANLINEATAVNPDVVDATVRLPGYLLPLEMDGRRAVEFLLVPYVGACIHTPPPSPNQVVYVVYPEGFEAEGLFTPVWITGPMKAESTDQTVGYVDGSSNVTVGYRMDASRVTAY